MLRQFMARAARIGYVLIRPKQLKLAIARRIRALFPELHAFQHIAEMQRELEHVKGRLHIHEVGARPTASASASTKDPFLLIDVRISQIQDRDRGIPRYTNAVARALSEKLAPGQVGYLIDPDLPEPDGSDMLRARGRIIAGHEAITELEHVSHFLQGCMFEYHKDADELVPKELGRFRPKLSAIVYDVIPGLYPEKYLKDRYLSERYPYIIGLLSPFDRLFSISERTRHDLSRTANIPLSMIETIYGGIDEELWQRAQTIARTSAGWLEVTNEAGEAFGIPETYWLYVAGSDFRKNLARAIEGYSIAQQKGGWDAFPLVVACSLNAHALSTVEKATKAHGLEVGKDIIATNRVSDTVLKTLYINAYATIFPSLYEGLGLPVLESYHFGTPVVGSNSSSLQEILLPDAQFDPTQAEAIASSMVKLSTNEALYSQILAHGRGVLRTCNWSAAADKISNWVKFGADRSDFDAPIESKRSNLQAVKS